MGFGPNLGWELGFGTPLHDPLNSFIDIKAFSVTLEKLNETSQAFSSPQKVTSSLPPTPPTQKPTARSLL